MKKFIAMAMAALMICAISATAFAADSAEVGYEASSSESSAEAGEVGVSTAVSSTTAVADVSSIKDTGVSSFLESKGVASTVNTAIANTGVKSEDLKVASFFEMTATGNTMDSLDKNGYVDVTIGLSGLQPGDAAVVVCFNGTEWVVCPTTVSADGKTITARFTNMGPIMILTGTNAAK